CGAPQTGAKPGLYSQAKGGEAVATSSGSPSIRPTALDMVSNTSQTMALTAAAAAWNSNAPPMAGSHGRIRSVFLTGLSTERSMWTRTAISLSVAKEAPFTAFARAMPRSEAKRQLLIEAPPSIWVALSVAGESIQQDWMEWYSWRLIVPVPLLTITFTCWRAWCRRDEAQPT